MLAGKYQLRQIIGRGGFGLVYDALHLGIDRQIALKVLLPEWSNKDPELALRFRREAVLSSQLRHPNTITVYDYGQTSDNVLFMAMEYVEGRTLSTVLRDEAPLPPERVVHILKQILASLHEAHRRGIIHRDLKPGNIMLTSHRGDNEFVKVLDFGIAKAISNDLLGGEQVSQTLTQAGQFCGTPRYMAPEQFRNGAITPACDLYSVGLISYELLTGKPAIVGETMVDLIVAQVAGPSLTLPGDLPLGQSLRQPLHRALRKDPSDRFATAESFLSALEDWDAEEPLFDDELEPTRLEDSNDQTHEGLREAPARRNLNDLNDLDDLDELGDLGLTPIARDPGDITALPTFTLGLTRDDEFPDPFDEPVTDQAERQKHAARAALDFDAPSGLTQPSRSDHLDRFALPPVEDDPPGFPLPDEPITDEFPPAFRRAAGEPPPRTSPPTWPAAPSSASSPISSRRSTSPGTSSSGRSCATTSRRTSTPSAPASRRRPPPHPRHPRPTATRPSTCRWTTRPSSATSRRPGGPGWPRAPRSTARPSMRSLRPGGGPAQTPPAPRARSPSRG